MQINHAMKMVSAAKLKRRRTLIPAMRPYSDKFTEILQNPVRPWKKSKCLHKTTWSNKALVVAIASNRGLAGAFNSNIMKELVRLNNNELVGVAVSYMTMGKKANDFAKRNKQCRLTTAVMSRSTVLWQMQQ
jgi:F-type H+-transporting ATPase subunit gamma